MPVVRAWLVRGIDHLSSIILSYRHVVFLLNTLIIVVPSLYLMQFSQESFVELEEYKHCGHFCKQLYEELIGDPLSTLLAL